MNFRLVALLLEAGDGDALDAGLDLGLGPGSELERSAARGFNPGQGRQDFGIPGQGDLHRFFEGERFFAPGGQARREPRHQDEENDP